MEKTGKTFNLEEKLKDWAYNSKYAAYYHEHGDTNMSEVICVSGYKKGSTYVINGKYDLGEHEDYYLDFDDVNRNKSYAGFTLTLQKVGDGFRFVSNILK